MSLFIRSSALLLIPPLLAGCASTGTLLGGDKYLQMFVEDEIVYEYSVPNSGMPCARNALINNLETNPKSKIVYRCSSEPAPATALPYSFVSYSRRGHVSGIEEPRTSTMRFASSAACHDMLNGLADDQRTLVSANCDGDGPPPRAQPGETLASAKASPAI